MPQPKPTHPRDFLGQTWEVNNGTSWHPENVTLTGEQVFALFEAIHAGETDRVKLAALVGEESLSPRRAAKATTLLKNADFIMFDSGDRVWKSLLPGAKV